MILVAIYDRVSESYANPFVVPSLAFAGRELANLVRHQPDHVYATNPEDFFLCPIGDWHPDKSNPLDHWGTDSELLSHRVPLTSFLIVEGDENGNK